MPRIYWVLRCCVGPQVLPFSISVNRSLQCPIPVYPNKGYYQSVILEYRTFFRKFFSDPNDSRRDQIIVRVFISAMFRGHALQNRRSRAAYDSTSAPGSALGPARMGFNRTGSDGASGGYRAKPRAAGGMP